MNELIQSYLQELVNARARLIDEALDRYGVTLADAPYSERRWCPQTNVEEFWVRGALLFFIEPLDSLHRPAPDWDFTPAPSQRLGWRIVFVAPCLAPSRSQDNRARAILSRKRTERAEFACSVRGRL